jgi:hypothetical protein
MGSRLDRGRFGHACAFLLHTDRMELSFKDKLRIREAQLRVSATEEANWEYQHRAMLAAEAYKKYQIELNSLLLILNEQYKGDIDPDTLKLNRVETSSSRPAQNVLSKGSSKATGSRAVAKRPVARASGPGSGKDSAQPPSPDDASLEAALTA